MSERHVVVGIDFSEIAGAALDRAVRDLRGDDSAVLHVVAVAEGDGPPLPGELTAGAKATFLAGFEATVRAYVEERVGATSLELRFHAAIGDPATRLLEHARSTDADLIVVGTHGRQGISRLVLGSVAEAIVRAAPCPVLVVRDPRSPAG